jgi:hypothetical protein
MIHGTTVSRRHPNYYNITSVYVVVIDQVPTVQFYLDLGIDQTVLSVLGVQLNSLFHSGRLDKPPNVHERTKLSSRAS